MRDRRAPPRAVGEGEVKVFLVFHGCMLPEYDAKEGTCK